MPSACLSQTLPLAVTSLSLVQPEAMGPGAQASPGRPSSLSLCSGESPTTDRPLT